MNGQYAKTMCNRALQLPGAVPRQATIGCIFYCDKISIGSFSRKSLFPFYVILDCYDNAILSKHMGKIFIGFISDFNSVSMQIHHMIGQCGTPGLLEANSSIGRRTESMKSFKRDLQHRFCSTIKDEITYSWNVGVDLFLPGHGITTVRFYAKAIISDAPQIRDLLG